jgi:hypothetical protein
VYDVVSVKSTGIETETHQALQRILFAHANKVGSAAPVAPVHSIGATSVSERAPQRNDKVVAIVGCTAMQQR